MDLAVRADALVKRYDGLVAVDGISFDVRRGIVQGILGPNGAGKTTLMRMVHGLSPRSSGALEVLGLDVERHGREVKRRLGVVPQEANLDQDMTARENLVVHGRFYGLTGAPLRKKADEMLEYVQLTEKANDRVTELSGGMKRRLLIARALMNDPELLVLDEPTTGLDPQSRSILWEKIRALRRAGMTVLLTTHYLDEAEKLSDHILLMDKGRIIERGTPRELIERHIGREVVELVVPPEEDARVVAKLGASIRGHERVGEHLHLFAQKGEPVVEDALRAGVKPESYLVRRATLEDVFLKLAGRRLEE